MRRILSATLVASCILALSAVYVPEATADTAAGGVLPSQDLIDACRGLTGRLEIGRPCRDPDGWHHQPVCATGVDKGGPSCRHPWDPNPYNCFQAVCVERVYTKDNVATTLVVCADEIARPDYTICGDDPDSLNCAIATCKSTSGCEQGCVGPGYGMDVTCGEYEVPHLLDRDGDEIELNDAVAGPRVPLYQLDLIKKRCGPGHDPKVQGGPHHCQRYVPWRVCHHHGGKHKCEYNWPRWHHCQVEDKGGSGGGLDHGCEEYVGRWCESEIPEDGDCIRAQCDDWGMCA